jgi:3-deoxy-D-manno-octulosonic-acid transferase
MNYDVILSVFTKTAYIQAQKTFNGVKVFRYFLDNPFTLKTIISEYPRALIIAETEIWPNLISFSYKNKVKIFIVNGRISDRSFRFYKFFGFFFKGLFSKIHRVYARSIRNKLRFEELGCKDVVFFGDIKVDGVIREFRHLSRGDFGLSSSDFLITFGSVRSKELDFVIDSILSLKDESCKFILAPRHLELIPLIVMKLKKVGVPWSYRTDIKSYPTVIVLNTLGELMSIYDISDICVVCGTFENYGGHNVLESLYLSKPTIIGKFYKNVDEVVKFFEERDAIFLVNDVNDFVSTVRRIRRDRESIEKIVRQASEEFFHIHKGVVSKIFEDIILQI